MGNVLNCNNTDHKTHYQPSMSIIGWLVVSLGIWGVVLLLFLV